MKRQTPGHQRPRNGHVASMRCRVSGPHGKTIKAQRRAAKIEIRKTIREVHPSAVAATLRRIPRGRAWIAQLVERRVEGPGVAGSIPAPCTSSLMML